MKYLVLLVATSSMMMPFLHAGKPHYKSAPALMKDFMNLSVQTDKNFEFWIEELRHHAPNKEKFAAFEKQLRKSLENKQDPLNVFNEHKGLFNQTTQIELLKLGLPKLKAAFKARLALHRRLPAVPKEANPELQRWLLLMRMIRHHYIPTQGDALNSTPQKLPVWLEGSYPIFFAAYQLQQKNHGTSS